MAETRTARVIQLRKRSDADIMDAKRTLVASNGNMDEAMDYLRERGIVETVKKSDHVAAEGLADIAISGNIAAIVELNSETDFVATSESFKDLLKRVTRLISENKPANVEEALEVKTENGTLNDDIISTTQKTGEKISLHRFTVVGKDDDDSFGAYLHQGDQVTTLVILEGADDATTKDVTMHVTAINPEFMTCDDISQERPDHERAIFREETLNEGGLEKIVSKIVEDRLSKFLSQICLAGQDSVKGSDQTVEQYASSEDGKLKSFIRYEVGERIKRKQDDFTQEAGDRMN